MIVVVVGNRAVDCRYRFRQRCLPRIADVRAVAAIATDASPVTEPYDECCGVAVLPDRLRHDPHRQQARYHPGFYRLLMLVRTATNYSKIPILNSRFLFVLHGPAATRVTRIRVQLHCLRLRSSSVSCMVIAGVANEDCSFLDRMASLCPRRTRVDRVLVIEAAAYRIPLNDLYAHSE